MNKSKRTTTLPTNPKCFFSAMIVLCMCLTVHGQEGVNVDNSPNITPVDIQGGPQMCKNSRITLSAPGYESYLWSIPDQFNETLEITEAGTYSVTVTNAAGGVATSSINITYFRESSLNIAGSTTYCSGSVTTLSLGDEWTNAEWSNGETTNSIEVSTEGILSVIALDKNGCIATGKVSISKVVELTPVITGDNTICEGEVSVLNAGKGFGFYEWNTGENSQTIEVREAGTYTVNVVDRNGQCSGDGSFDVVEATIVAPDIVGPRKVSPTENIKLSVDAYYSSYEWSTGSTESSITVTGGGIYEVTVSDDQGCYADAKLKIINQDSIIQDSIIPTPENDTEYSGFFDSSYTSDPKMHLSDSNWAGGNDITRVMQTKLAGLSVLANAYTPGGSSRINMRGYRSLRGENQPMIMLNGMPIDNSEWNNTIAGTDKSNRLIDIDPNLIESIELIKSAAGRAKYGIKGANGIIHIKTKKGFKSRPRVNFSSSFGYDEITMKPERQSTYSQGRYLEGVSEYRGPETAEGDSWGPAIADLYFDGNQEYEFDENGALTLDRTLGGNLAKAYDPYDFYEKGSHRNLSLDIAGGTDFFDYFLSANTNKELGIIPTNSFTRNNLSAILNFNVSEKFSLQLNAMLSSADANRSQTGANLQGISLGILRNTPTFDLTNGLSDPVNNPNSYQLSDQSQRSYRHGIYDSPYWSINKNKHNDKVARQLIKLSGSYSLMQNLELLFNVGIDQFNEMRIGGEDINLSGFGGNSGSAYERNLKFGAQSGDMSVCYNILNSTMIDVTSTLGINYFQSEFSYDLKDGEVLKSSGNVSLLNTNEIDFNNYTNEIKRVGGLLSINAKLKEYLTIDGSIRLDNTNKFGDKVDGFVSYGLGAGLSLLDLFPDVENRLIDIDLIASVGKFGNENNQSRMPKYIPTVIGGDGFIGSPDLPGEFELNNFIVSNLITAETTKAFDVGIDISILNNLVDLSVIYYSELSTGLIHERGISSTTGLRRVFGNNETSMSNKGVDISLRFSLLSRQKLNWKAALNFNSFKNLVVDFDLESMQTIAGFTSTSSSFIEDQPYSSITGNGFMSNEEGQLIIDEEGWPLQDPDKKVLANPNPDWVMYLNNSFLIGKNLNLSASIDISQGGDRWCGTCGIMDYFGTSQLSADEREMSFVFDGVTENGLVNTQEVVLAGGEGSEGEFYRRRYGFGGITEMNIHDASWVRLRNVSISYDFSSLVRIKGLSKLSLGLYGENLFIKTKYPGFDPETNLVGSADGIGLDYFNNPGTKSYGFSIKASY